MSIDRDAFVKHVKERAVSLGIVSGDCVEAWFSFSGIVHAAERVAIASFVTRSEDELVRRFLSILHTGMEIRFLRNERVSRPRKR